MSFKIECLECGTSQIFTTGEKARQHDNIDIEIYEGGFLFERAPEEITLSCGNYNCKKYVDLKY